MLSGILKKEECAACRFCCSFKKTSLWETPVFTKENIDAIKKDKSLKSDSLNESENGGLIFATYDLSGLYKTCDPNEEIQCPFLSETGCLLNDEQKPIDCKIWPVRIMRKDSKTVLALSPSCPVCNISDMDKIKKYVDETIRKDITEYAKDHPYLIKEFRSEYTII